MTDYTVLYTERAVDFAKVNALFLAEILEFSSEEELEKISDVAAASNALKPCIQAFKDIIIRAGEVDQDSDEVYVSTAEQALLQAFTMTDDIKPDRSLRNKFADAVAETSFVDDTLLPAMLSYLNTVGKNI